MDRIRMIQEDPSSVNEQRIKELKKTQVSKPRCIQLTHEQVSFKSWNC